MVISDYRIWRVCWGWEKGKVMQGVWFLYLNQRWLYGVFLHQRDSCSSRHGTWFEKRSVINTVLFWKVLTHKTHNLKRHKIKMYINTDCSRVYCWIFGYSVHFSVECEIMVSAGVYYQNSLTLDTFLEYFSYCGLCSSLFSKVLHDMVSFSLL